jgi:hypothetical protein
MDILFGNSPDPELFRHSERVISGLGTGAPGPPLHAPLPPLPIPYLSYFIFFTRKCHFRFTSFITEEFAFLKLHQKSTAIHTRQCSLSRSPTGSKLASPGSEIHMRLEGSFLRCPKLQISLAFFADVTGILGFVIFVHS